MKETIKRESTWDYPDQDGKLTYEEYHVETIETWEWSDELNRYKLVYLEEKDTGEYIPYDEDDYISAGVTIPTPKETRKEEVVKIKTERKIIWGGGTIWYIGKCYPQLASADEYEIIVSHINDKTFLKRIVRSVPWGKLGQYTKAINECHIFCIDNNGAIKYRESE